MQATRRGSDEYELEEARKLLLLGQDGTSNDRRVSDAPSSSSASATMTGSNGKRAEQSVKHADARPGHGEDEDEEDDAAFLDSIARETFEESDAQSPSSTAGVLPSSSSSRRGGPLPAWALIFVWITLSSAVIFQNARILTTLKFPFPITLTSIHLIFQTIFTRLLARYTDLIPSPKAKSVLPTTLAASAAGANGHSLENGVNGAASKPSGGYLSADDKTQDITDFRSGLYWKTVVPIGLLFALSLVLSNYVYLYLSVAFIQMIKAGSPVAVLIASFVFGLRSPTLKLVSIICSISIGVAIASYGEADFNLIGFLLQVTAIAIEASRLSLIEILLSGIGLSPLQSLHAFAPVCLAFLAVMILPIEGVEPFRRLANLGLPLIIVNASLTCALNLSAIYLIGISSIVLSLSKVLKDILIIFGSAIALHTPITPIQWVGYAIALLGLYLYKTYG